MTQKGINKMKTRKLKDFFNRAKDAINGRNKELEGMKLDLMIDRTLSDEEDLLILDIQYEFIEQEQKNIKELRKIYDKYKKEYNLEEQTFKLSEVEKMIEERIKKLLNKDNEEETNE